MKLFNLSKEGKFTKSTKKVLAFLLSFALVLPNLQLGTFANVYSTHSEESQENSLRLWYDAPSTRSGMNEKDIWSQFSLPIGNGDMGANVYGDIRRERLTFNEKTLWTGGPSNTRPDYNGGNLENKGQNGATLRNVQELFRQNRNAEASALARRDLVGLNDSRYTRGYGAYQLFGNIYIDYPNVSNSTSNYVRDLDLRTALASVSFTDNNTTYEREFFISNPADVLVAKLSATGTDKLNVNISFPSAQGASTVASNNELVIQGEVRDNQLKFASILKAVNVGGTLRAENNRLIVEGADTVYFYVNAKTDYKNVYPNYRTNESSEDLLARVRAKLEKALEKGYEKVKEEHIEDYKRLFDRVELNLMQTTSTKPTNLLLNAYKNNSASEEEKRQLEVMLFQFGRYLQIASSRENSQLPANLQGVWNYTNSPPWASDYHLNVNLQMNYWPTYMTNLAECALPLISYVESLRKPGRLTAKIYTGIESVGEAENGFMAHTQNTPFGWTCPGWSFDWGWSPAGVPWILQNCFEHYEYTSDVDFLRENIYPMLKEQAKFYSQLLIKDENDKYISSPAYSPEHGPITNGNTYEHSLIWQLFNDAIIAGNILSEDEALINDWKDKKDNLKGPIEIGSDGQIKEWYHETTLNSVRESQGYGHRHISHALALFPGDLITKDNKEHFEAARVTMKNRTDTSTGWGMGQRINTWARLRDGNKAHKLITDLFKAGIYPNLFDYHAPSYFQIDGNFGMTAGVAEMLMQSNAGYVSLLPALPDAWANGNISGLVARGNFALHFSWKNKKIDSVRVVSNKGNDLVLEFDNAALANLKTVTGKKVDFEVISNDRIRFATTMGEAYELSEIPNTEGESINVDLSAIKVEENEARLSFNPVEGSENVKYKVYRRVNEENWTLLNAELSETTYVDNTAYDEYERVEYKITALINSKESNDSNIALLKDIRGIGFVDDTDERIEYTGNFGDWNRDRDNYNGTIKYLNSPNGTEKIKFKFYGTGIEVYTAKNNDRGYYDVYVDGTFIERVDTYSQNQERKAKIFEKTDLTKGIHEIELRVANEKREGSRGTKVELDAFKVLNKEFVLPTSISINTKTGIRFFSKENSSVELVTSFEPNTVEDKRVAYSVETTRGTVRGSIDGNVLTMSGGNGILTVRATYLSDPSIEDTMTINVELPSVTEEVTFVDDSNPNNKRERNPEITFSQGWGNPYLGEATKHYGGGKTETRRAGSYFEYEFEGNGVEVYAQKHNNFSAFEVEVDGQNEGTVSLAGSTSGEPQQLIFSKKGMPNQRHRIKLTLVRRDNKTEGNLDYIKIFKEIPRAVDKSNLQAALEENADKNEEYYTADTYREFKEAYDLARVAMNSADTTEEEANRLAQELREKASRLAISDSGKPAFAENARIEVLTKDTDFIRVKFDKATRASSYDIYVTNISDSLDEVLKSNETTNIVKINDLLPDKEYKIRVVAKNLAGDSTNHLEIRDTTLEVFEDAKEVTNLSARKTKGTNDVVITFEDPNNKEKHKNYYLIYVNGEEVGRVSEPSFTLNNVTDSKVYNINVVAVNKFLSRSKPARTTFDNLENTNEGSTTEETPDTGEGSGTTTEEPSTGEGSGTTTEEPSTGEGSGTTTEEPSTGEGSGSTTEEPSTGEGSGTTTEEPSTGEGSGSTTEEPSTGEGSGSTTEEPNTGTGTTETPNTGGSSSGSTSSGSSSGGSTSSGGSSYYGGSYGTSIRTRSSKTDASGKNTFGYSAIYTKNVDGKWNIDTGIWRFILNNGSLVKNTFATIKPSIDYNQKPLIYYFDKEGNLKTSWILVNGRWYYLNEVDNENLGRLKTSWFYDTRYKAWFYLDEHTGEMALGWKKINNKWYYFSKESHRTLGAMYVNEKTPDGYYVGSDGAYIK